MEAGERQVLAAGGFCEDKSSALSSVLPPLCLFVVTTSLTCRLRKGSGFCWTVWVNPENFT